MAEGFVSISREGNTLSLTLLLDGTLGDSVEHGEIDEEEAFEGESLRESCQARQDALRVASHFRQRQSHL